MRMAATGPVTVTCLLAGGLVDCFWLKRRYSWPKTLLTRVMVARFGGWQLLRDSLAVRMIGDVFALVSYLVVQAITPSSGCLKFVLPTPLWFARALG